MLTVTTNYKWEPEEKTFGEELKELRMERGYTLRDVGRMTQLSPYSFSKFENNLKIPSERDVHAMCEVYGTIVFDLCKKYEIKYRISRETHRKMKKTTKFFDPEKARIFADNFNNLLEERGLSCKQMSYILGMPETCCWEMTRAEKMPTDDLLEKIAKIFNLDKKDLFIDPRTNRIPNVVIKKDVVNALLTIHDDREFRAASEAYFKRMMYGKESDLSNFPQAQMFMAMTTM